MSSIHLLDTGINLTQDGLPFPGLCCLSHHYMVDGDGLDLFTSGYMPLLRHTGTAQLGGNMGDVVQLKPLKRLDEPYHMGAVPRQSEMKKNQQDLEII